MKGEQYIWRTVKDSDVRPAHAVREGQTFSWANPPEGGHPGEDYNCRCWAEAVKGQASGLQQELISSTNQSRPWDTFDFAYHFWKGNGRAVTLPEIGHLRGVIAISIQEIFPRVEAQVAERMKAIKSGSLTYRTSRDYDFGDAHWVLGDGVVNTFTVGEVKQNGNILSLEAEVTYSYSDEITDPGDFREVLLGTSSTKHPQFEDYEFTEFGGTAYPVTGGWKTKLTGSIALEEVQ